MPTILQPFAAGPIESVFNSLRGTATDTDNDLPRTAMVFTSRKRQMALDAAFVGPVQIAQPLPLRAGETRSIAMEVNPNSVEFNQPKRFARQDTQTGVVFHHFNDLEGKNNDILTINFRGSTGNINRLVDTEVDRGLALKKLAVWHNLYLLTREPMLLSDGKPNVFEVVYSSALLTVPIHFQGFFSRVLEWSEQGTKPNSRDYTMEFTVTSVAPNLDELVTLVIAATQGAAVLGANNLLAGV